MTKTTNFEHQNSWGLRRPKALQETAGHDVLWIAFGQIASAVAALIGLRVMTEVLPPNQFGIFVLSIGLVALALNFFSYPVLQASIRFYTEFEKNGNGRTLRCTSQHMYWGAIAIGGFGLVVLGVILGPMHGAPGWVGLILAILLIVDAVRAYETAMLNAARRQRAMSIWQASEAWARPLVAALAVVVFDGGAMTALLGYIAASLVINFCFAKAVPLVGAMGDYDDAISADVRRRVWNYIIPLIPLGALGWINGMGDRYLIAGMLSISDAGIYAAAYSLASRPYIMVGTFLESWLRPILYDAISADDKATVRSTIYLWILAGLVIGIVFAFALLALGPIITQLFLSSEFSSGYSLFVWIACGYMALNIQQVLARVFYGYGKNLALVYADTFTALIGLPLIVLGIQTAGILGAAMAVAAYFLVKLIITATAAFMVFSPKMREIEIAK